MSDTTPKNQKQTQDIQGFDDPPRKMPKWVKYAGGSVLVLAVVAGGASVVASQLIDQQKYKKLIIEKVEDETGYKIDWQGNIGLSFLPLPHASVNDLVVSANSRDILSVKSADVSIALMPLLSGKVEVSDISIDGPKVTLVTLKDGEQTWITGKLREKTGKKEQGNNDADEKTKDREMDVSFDVIEITDGVLVWDDQSKGVHQTVEDLDLRLKAESLSGPFEMNSGLVWNGKKIEAKVTTGDLDMQNGLYPLQAKLALPENNIRFEYSGVVSAKDKVSAEGDVSVEITDLAAAIKSVTGDDKVSLPDDLKGKTTLSTKAKFLPDKITLDDLDLQAGVLGYGGKFSVLGLGNEESAPKVSFDLKSTKKSESGSSALARFMDDLQMSATGSLNGKTLSIEQSRIVLNDNDLSFKGTVAQNAERPNVDLTMTAKRLDVDQIMKKLGKESSSGEGASMSGGSSADGSDKGLGMVLPFDGRIRADIGELDMGGRKYYAIGADVSSIGKGIQVTKFSATLPENISIKADGSVADTQTLSGLDMNFGVNVPNVELAAGSYGVTLPDLPRKVGAATVNGKISGDLKALGFDVGVGVWGGTVSGVGTVGTPLEKPVINKLKFAAKHPDFVEAIHIIQPDFVQTSGFSGPLDLSGQVAWGDDQYHVTAIKGLFGKTSLNGEMDLALSPKPSVTGTLNIGDLVLPSSTKSTSGSGSAGTGTASSSDKARWSREAVDVSWMRKFDADLKIAANSITQNLWKFTNANLEFVLKDGTLSISDMSAGLFGGNAALNGTIKSGAGERDPLGVSGKMTASNVDAHGLVSAVVGAPNDTLSGTLSNVDVEVNATGLSPAALVQTLGGQGTMTGQNLIIKGVDAAQLGMAAKGSYKPLERAGTLFGSFGQGQTEFTTFDSSFDIQSGVVNFSKINFDGPKATLASTGNVNLPLWTIDLKNTMTIKDTDIPPFDFTVKGPLDNPTKAGGAVIENYLRSKAEKKATKLIGKLLGVEDQSTTATTGSGTDQTGASTTESSATTEQVKPKDQLKKDALKALGGLLGQ